MAIISKNIKSCDECLPFVKLTYNRAIHSTIHYSPFEVIYRFNSLKPLDLLPFFTSTNLIKHCTMKGRRALRNKIPKLI